MAVNVCAATTLDVSRIPMLSRLLNSWPAPIAAAILAEQNSRLDWSSRSQVAIQKMTAQLDTERRQLLRISVVENVGFDCPPRFPFNLLRNRALSRCVEERVLILDIDFVPQPATNLLPARLSAIPMGAREALVLPAFEVSARSLAAAESLPSVMDKDTLRTAFTRGHLVTFGTAGGTRDPWPRGHVCTKTNMWMNHSRQFTVQHCDPFYEPYVMLPRAAAPPFDEIFKGRGLDKVSFIYELFASGVTFRTAPNMFVVHYPHAAAHPDNCSNAVSDAAAT